MAAHGSEALLPVLLALPLTVPVALTDLRRRVIPDALNLALLLAGLAVLALRDPVPEIVALAFVEAGFAYLLFRGFRAGYGRLRGRTGLGLGDVKFVAAAMPWVGLGQLPVMILIASTTALLAVAVMRLRGRRVGAGTRLPFGPFLVLGLHGSQFLGSGFLGPGFLEPGFLEPGFLEPGFLEPGFLEPGFLGPGP